MNTDNNLQLYVSSNPFELDSEMFGDLNLLTKKLGIRTDSAIRSKQVILFLMELEKKYYPENFALMELENYGKGQVRITKAKSSFVKSASGRYGGTKAHVYVLLYIASIYSHTIAIEAYDAITNIDKIFEAISNFDFSEYESELKDVPVYVFTAIEATSGKIKIGVSKNPEARIRQLQQGNPDTIVLTSCYESKRAYSVKEEILNDNIIHAIKGDWISSNATFNI